jgi:hypothetical protein
MGCWTTKKCRKQEHTNRLCHCNELKATKKRPKYIQFKPLLTFSRYTLPGMQVSRLQPQTAPTSEKRLLAMRQAEMIEEVKRELKRDAWLSSFGKDVDGERKPFINMELDDYLELLDWTGRQVKEGKRGKIPPHLAHILERLDIETEHWIHTVLHFGSLFYRVAGKVQSILVATRRAGQQWLRGKPAAKQIFG